MNRGKDSSTCSHYSLSVRSVLVFFATLQVKRVDIYCFKTEADVPVRYHHLSERSTPVGTSADTKMNKLLELLKGHMERRRTQSFIIYQPKHSAHMFLTRCSWSGVSAPAGTHHRSAASCRDVHISRLRPQNTA